MPPLEPVRVSSVQLLPRSDASYAKPAAEVAATIAQLFSARGFPVVDKRAIRPNVTYYVFSGPRTQTVNTSGYVGAYGGAIRTQSYLIGSWFVARVEDAGAATHVFIIGKPTINNMAVCSDADVRLTGESDYFCRDTKSAATAPERAEMTGREEADTVRGIFIQLDQTLSAAPAAAGAVAPAATRT